MSVRRLQAGTLIDGFRLEDNVHRGSMSALWRVTRPDSQVPMIMKLPLLGDGDDPSAIVGFEVEQMIMPTLSGIHVPSFVSAGDFTVQPYIVMEFISGKS